MYIVSACLAGINCMYNGKSSMNERVMKLIKEGNAIAVCPELLGGLKTPRPACEIIVDAKGIRKVFTRDGKDFTRAYEEGARKILAIARKKGIVKAILKSRSPSCGYGLIHDGTFTGAMVKGNGLTADLLLKNGIEVYSEKEIDNIKIND